MWLHSHPAVYKTTHSALCVHRWVCEWQRGKKGTLCKCFLSSNMPGKKTSSWTVFFSCICRHSHFVLIVCVWLFWDKIPINEDVPLTLQYLGTLHHYMASSFLLYQVWTLTTAKTNSSLIWHCAAFLPSWYSLTLSFLIYQGKTISGYSDRYRQWDKYFLTMGWPVSLKSHYCESKIYFIRGSHNVELQQTRVPYFILSDW